MGKHNYNFNVRLDPLSIRLWFLYYIVAHLTMRTYGVNQAFRFVEDIWFHRKSRQIHFFFKDLNFNSYAPDIF